MDCTTVDECLTAITAGIALGLQLPAPVGSRIWEASVHLGEDMHFQQSHANLGVYPTRSEAERAVACWAIQEWATSEMPPWGSESADSWLPHHPVADILALYFGHYAYQHYAIREHIVTTTPSGPLTLRAAHSITTHGK